MRRRCLPFLLLFWGAAWADQALLRTVPGAFAVHGELPETALAGPEWRGALKGEPFGPERLGVRLASFEGDGEPSAEELSRALGGVRVSPALTSGGGKVVALPQVIAALDHDVSPQHASSLLDEYELTLSREVLGLSGAYLADCLDRQCDPVALAKELAGEPVVRWAEANLLEERKPRYQPQDAYYHDQWYLNNTGQAGSAVGADIGMERAWEASLGDANIVVAVIDTGVDLAHPEFAGRLVPGYDFEARDNDPTAQFDDHGTLVASLIAANHDGAGMAGVAPNVGIMPIRLLDSGTATNLDEGEAIIWAAQNGADVINCSWGPVDFTGVLQPLPAVVEDAIIIARSQGRGGLGTPLIWASGNGGAVEDCSLDEYISHPLNFAVGATTNFDERAGYSEGCPALDLVAPSSGGTKSVTAASWRGTYTDGFGGTSAAAPLVAGAVALALSCDPSLTADEVYARLRDSGEKIGDWPYSPLGRNDAYGYGRLRVDLLLEDLGACVVPPEAPLQPLSGPSAPFYDSFEDDQGWTIVGTPLWERGETFLAPAAARRGSQVFATRLNDDYRHDFAHAYLESPAASLASLQRPTLRFHAWHETQGDTRAYDGLQALVSTDGRHFELLIPEGGYEDSGITALGNQGGIGGLDGGAWREYVCDLSGYAGETIVVRFYFAADSYESNWPGVAIDDVSIADRDWQPPQPPPPGIQEAPFAPAIEATFEGGLPAGWHIYGAPQWEVGPPTVGPVGAAEGTSVAATNLDGSYVTTRADSYLVSPPLDLRNTLQPVLAFESWHELDAGRDGAIVEYAVGDTGQFQPLMPLDESVLAAVSRLGGALALTGTSEGWQTIMHHLPKASPVRVRFRLASNYTSNGGAGWCLDALRIVDGAALPETPSVALAGFGLTDLISGRFGNVQAYAFIPGGDALPQLALGGLPTGRFLNDEGVSGDAVAGDGLSSLALNGQFFLNSGAFPVEMLVQSETAPEAVTFWPYLTVLP